METDCISLSYLMHCLLEGKNLESNAAKRLFDYTFPSDAEIFESLVNALQSGKIKAQGIFARIQLDHPEIPYRGPDEDDDFNVKISLLSADYRGRPNIIIGMGAEALSSNIEKFLWWNEGAIWEKSILWINSQGFGGENRWRDLKIEPTAPFLPDRPYGFEELNCYLDVTLNLSEAQDWAGAQGLHSAKPVTRNIRNAGAKPTENWKEIEEFLAKEIEKRRTWVDWNDVWHSLHHLRENTNSTEATDQPYKKLEKRLRDHNKELLVALRGQINTSRK